MAGLSLSLLLVVGVVTWQTLADDPYVAAPPAGPSAAAVDPAGAGRVLGEFVAAAASADPEAARALAPADDPAAGDRLAAIATNAGELEVRDLSARYVDATGPAAADGSWSARADLGWRFAGFDRAPALAEVEVTFRSVDGEVALVSFGGGEARSPLWLAGPVAVRRTPETLVLAARAEDADRYARLAERAVPVVRRVVTGWRPRLVVEIPATADDLDRALDAEPGTYASIAAVTTSVDGSLAPDAPVHVMVNPAELGRLRATGAQVVMSHEATHVATDAPSSSSTPLWLLEGFADYVALRDVRIPETTAAAQIIEQVRRDGPPDALPGATEFDLQATHLGAVYESAWLACVVLAERAGEAALVELYDDVAAGTPVAEALRDDAGLSEAELVRAWRDRLSDLAG
ncbi:hypothetical protein [Nocardioides lianchengensis]|uniref:Peptidase MA superfamily protein n=1 Tax=Nocardioides lianchengensis TaxID=1045774 RepID=A0A1G6MX71_9ACTN|nr:hypothetical protein [Nocardioides lianchengensis]NYG10562.1 hypothetical protein [Nocardioides lianchengensis]SDC59586.1 hypothetical protein SAMN05421872_10345 [Nocardioides lianchengensis]